MMTRKQFSISFKAILRILFAPILKLAHRMSCCFKKKLSDVNRENEIYFRARKIYYNELDVIQLLKTTRMSDKFRNMFMTKT